MLRAKAGLGLLSLSVRSLEAVVDKLCLCFILALVSFRTLFTLVLMSCRTISIHRDSVMSLFLCVLLTTKK